jgi:hypothetical protein
MPGSADLVRELARRGELADRAAGTRTGSITGGAYDVVWPVVFDRLTRGLEIRRGHHGCAASVASMQPDCLDRFQDDVEAVIDDLLRNAKVPINNLDGWIASRLNPVTVDAHRRRRGERGALARPRLPGWLATALGGDPWLTALAIDILVWVGIPATAGIGIWPLGAWADQRARATGERSCSEAEVLVDVETVLAAMRQSQTWYAKFVERPLGRKQPPVWSAPRTDSDHGAAQPHLALIERHATDDTHLAELAAVAVDAIERRLRRGDDPRAAVAAVVRAVFAGGTGAEEMDRTPGTAPAYAARAAELVADPATIDRITAAALDILGGGFATPPASPRPMQQEAAARTTGADAGAAVAVPEMNAARPTNTAHTEPQRQREQENRDAVPPALALPDLHDTTVAQWHRRLSTNPSVKRNHWRTKTHYFGTVASLLVTTPAEQLTWTTIVEAAAPYGSRSTFYEVAGSNARHPLIKELIGGGTTAHDLAAYYQRTNAVAQLIDEAKVWSYWPHRERMLAAGAAASMTPRSLEAGMTESLRTWARANPQLAAALSHAPPVCAVEDLLVIRDGQLNAGQAVDQLTEELRRTIPSAVGEQDGVHNALHVPRDYTSSTDNHAADRAAGLLDRAGRH